MSSSADHRRTAWLCLGLLLGTCLLYLPVRQHEFVTYDDPLYLTANPHVQAGLTVGGLHWAFGRVAGDGTYWHPLTWLSHMLDCQVFGLRAGAHHFVSVVIHAVNAMLLFVTLQYLSRSPWRSVAVAALFAFHPLQVDSVAWAAERKNLLSGVFWMLTLLAYAGYARRPGVGRYLLVAGCLALGLMAKPTLVVLPGVLLLLDVWPLRRIQFAAKRQSDGTPDVASTVSVTRAVLEKIPLGLLSLGASAITLLAHERLAAIHSAAHFSLATRIANAALSYVRYLGKTVWPTNLSFFYPHPGAWPMEMLVPAAAVLVGISWLVLRQLEVRPYLAVGWLWFTGSLVPVIGLIQVSDQAMADRFMYLPLIGLLIMLVWGGADLFARFRRFPAAACASALAAMVAGVILSGQQLSHWQNSESLFRHALAVTRDNFVAHNNLGNVLDRAGQYAEAKAHYLAAIRIRPRLGGAHYNLANLLFREGNFAAALEHYGAAVELEPAYADARHNLAVTLTKLSRDADAVVHFQEALRLKPDFAEAHYGLGQTLARLGRTPEAIAELVATVRLRPSAAPVYNELGILLARQGDPAGAATNFARLTILEPNNPDARYNLANSLLAQGKLPEAAATYAEVLRLNPRDARAREKLQHLGGTAPPATP